MYKEVISMNRQFYGIRDNNFRGDLHLCFVRWVDFSRSRSLSNPHWISCFSNSSDV